MREFVHGLVDVMALVAFTAAAAVFSAFRRKDDNGSVESWFVGVMLVLMLPVLTLAFDDMENLAGPTNWGMLRYDKQTKRITIGGHESWSATGFVRPDGRVEINWIYLANGKTCPAVYVLGRGDGGNGEYRLLGDWGWPENAYYGKDGDLQGETLRDTIRRVAGAAAQ